MFKGHCGRHGSVQFQLFGPRETHFLNYVRTVDLTHDGSRWDFSTGGEQQPFETPDRYRARNKTDRFTSEMLEAYCRALGIELFDPSFYGSRATPVTTPVKARTTTPPPAELQIDGVRVRMRSEPIQLEEFSLAEVQRRHCIGPGAGEMLTKMRGGQRQ